MSHFLVEIRIPGAERPNLQRASRALEAAQGRLHRRGVRVRTVRADVHSDASLRWLLEAPSLDAVRRLLAVALLPPARVRQVADPPPF